MIILLKSILYLVQAIALFIGFKNQSALKKSTLKYFLHYLVFTSIIEISANFIRKYTLYNNIFVYNIYDIITFSFYIYWFYFLLKKDKKVIILGFIYFVALIINLILESFLNVLNINFYVGTLIILILVVMYFSYLLQKKEVVYFNKIPEFWISTGVLIFNIGFLPLIFMLNFDGINKVYYQLIVLILNLILYGCFIKAFLCQKKI